MRTSRYFKARALELLARTDLTPRDRSRLLELNRAACAAFRQAQVAGVLDKVIPFKPEPKAKRLSASVRKAIEWHAAQIERLAG